MKIIIRTGLDIVKFSANFKNNTCYFINSTIHVFNRVFDISRIFVSALSPVRNLQKIRVITLVDVSVK